MDEYEKGRKDEQKLKLPIAQRLYIITTNKMGGMQQVKKVFVSIATMLERREC